MNMLLYVKKIIGTKAFIKGFYTCGLLIWTMMLLNDATSHPFQESSVGIPYVYLFWPPTLAIILHLLINSKLTWVLIFLSYNVLVILFVKVFIIEDYLAYHGGEKGYMNSMSSYILSGIITTMVFIVDWIIFKTRPTALPQQTNSQKLTKPNTTPQIHISKSHRNNLGRAYKTAMCSVTLCEALCYNNPLCETL